MTELDYIAEGLRTHAVKVDSVSQDPSNVREHPEKNKEAVKSSLREFGQRQVLVARKEQRTIEAGNLRLECARELGWSHVAVIFVDDDDLEAARYAIADNRTSDLGEWDGEGLGDVLGAIDDPPPGYTDEDVGDLLDALQEPDPEEWGDAFDAAPDEDHEPETSWRFILHQEQKELVEDAVRQAKDRLDCECDLNDNSNGNALWAMARWYLEHG